MDQDRGRDFRRKKFPTMREKEEKPMKRPIILMKAKDGEKMNANKVEEAHIPTILLKTRDGESRAVSPQTSSSSKNSKESDTGPTYQLAPRVPAPDLSNILSGPPQMKSCVKLLDDETQIIQDGLLEYLTESNDFLVVGCLGLQGSGKSTILSHFARPNQDFIQSETMIFKRQTKSHIDSNTHCTDGIDAYVTDERVILLDAQPLLSLSILTKHYNCEGNLSARSCSRDDPDYPCIESDMELLSLQYLAFFLTVCHVVIFVQDYDCNDELIKLLQTAEMLKPSTGVHSDEDTLLEYFPHTVLIHNKIDDKLFNKRYLQILQSEKPRKKREKKEKDSNKPKRAPSAYMLWFNENREKIKQDNPGISFTDIAKKAGELWKKLDDKSEWEKKSSKMKDEYLEAMNEYKATAKAEGGSSGKSKKSKSTSSSSKSSSAAVSSSPIKSGSGGAYISKEFIEDSDSSSDSDDDKKPAGKKEVGGGSDDEKDKKAVKSGTKAKSKKSSGENEDESDDDQDYKESDAEDSDKEKVAKKKEKIKTKEMPNKKRKAEDEAVKEDKKKKPKKDAKSSSEEEEEEDDDDDEEEEEEEEEEEDTPSDSD